MAHDGLLKRRKGAWHLSAAFRLWAAPGLACVVAVLALMLLGQSDESAALESEDAAAPPGWSSTDRRPVGSGEGERWAEVAEEPSGPSWRESPLFCQSLGGFRGRLVDASGQPVPGSSIQAWRFGAGTFAREGKRVLHDWEHGSGISAEDGRFRIGGLWPGFSYYRHPGEAWTVVDGVSVRGEIEIRLDPTFVLTVEVRDAPTARLGLYAGDGQTRDALGMYSKGEHRVPIAARTSRLPDGRQRIQGLSPGRYSLRAQHATGSKSILVDIEKDSELALQLEPRSGFTVLVADPSGRPIPAAVVFRRSRDVLGYTDKNGRLQVTPATGEELRIGADHPAYVGGDVHDVKLPVDRVRLTLGFPGRIEGTLVAEEPCSFEGLRIVLDSLEHFLDMDIRPDADGRFLATIQKPGTWEIGSISAPDTDSVDFRIVGQDDASIQVRAGMTTRVVVHVAWKPPRPVAKVAGTVQVNGRPAVDLLLRLLERGFAPRVVSIDEHGRFDFGTVFDEEIGLELITKRVEGSILWQDTIALEWGVKRDLRIEIQAGTLGGTVIGLDGKPMARTSVSLKNESSSLTGSTGGDGRFRFDIVPAGEYELSAGGFGDRSRGWIGGLWIQTGQQREVEVRTRRRVGVAGHVDLSKIGMRGRCYLRFEGPVRERIFVYDGKGFFGSRDLVPGSYRVSILFGKEHPLEIELRSPVIVGPHGTRDLALVLDRSYLPKLRRRAKERSKSLDELLESLGLWPRRR